MKDRTTVQLGPEGRYQVICETLGRDLKADAVVLIVIKGRHGTGMSVSTGKGNHELGYGSKLVAILRAVADDIEAGGQPDGIGYNYSDPEG